MIDQNDRVVDHDARQQHHTDAGRGIERLFGEVVDQEYADPRRRDLDAETAERWGYLNRALPPEDLRAFVEKLARRIASFPPQAVALAKQSVDAAEPRREGLLEEAFRFQQLLRTRPA